MVVTLMMNEPIHKQITDSVNDLHSRYFRLCSSCTSHVAGVSVT